MSSVGNLDRQPLPGKQYVSCTSCRRRKLKCDREAQGCGACTKAQLPCLYPALEQVGRRKRGPYRKDKSHREKELERAYELMESKCEQLTTQIQDHSKSGGSSAATRSDYGAPDTSPSDHNAPKLSKASPDTLPVDACRQAFVFGPDMVVSDLTCLHPPSSQILEYWYIYTANVDPMTKIVHAPSLARRIIAVKDDLPHLDRSMEALMFSIYLAGLTSMSAADVRERFPQQSKAALLQRFKLATEKALANANFLSSRDLTTLQACVIYLICLRGHDKGDMLWTLIGSAIRVAQLMGLSCDGSRFALPPLEVELRRRLWWNIRFLEGRCAETNKLNPASMEQWSDTKFPLNVNDEDLRTEAVEAPQPRMGCTDMTFCLISFELVTLISRLNGLPQETPWGVPIHSYSTINMQKKFDMIEACRAALESNYLRHCDSSRPFDWMMVTFAKTILTNVRLMVYHPFDRPLTEPLNPVEEDEVFLASVEVIEYAHYLKSEPRVENWAWFFREHHQWRALTYVLTELGFRSGSEIVDRAWSILDIVLHDWDSIVERNKHDRLWRSMNNLMLRARRVREAQQNFRSQSVPQRLPLQFQCQSAFTHGYSNGLSPRGFGVEGGASQFQQSSINNSLGLPSSSGNDMFETASGNCMMTSPGPGFANDSKNVKTTIGRNLGEPPEATSSDGMGDFQDLDEFLISFNSDTWANLAQDFQLNFDTM